MALASQRIFDTIVGHQNIEKLLTGLIANGRVPNSMLFVGPQGQGKKLMALGFAQAMLCERVAAKQETISVACGECSSCRRVFLHQHEGLIILAPEKGQIKIEAARQVIHQISFSSWGRAQIVIIDEAHLLNPQAANALLKSIEEPPKNTHFILISPSQEGVLKTLRSRSQIVRFRGLPKNDMATFSQNQLEPEHQAELRTIWQQILSHQDALAIEQVREKITGREEALQATQFWLEMARDTWHEQEELRPRLSSMSQKILQMERDLIGNCDVKLTLENFIYETSLGS